MAYVDPVYHGGKNHPEQVTDEYLVSPVDSSGFRQAKLLQCGHSLSADILQLLLSQVQGNVFPCPVCGAGNVRPAGGVSAFSDNLFVNHQVERLLRRHNKATGRDDSLYNITNFQKY